MSANKVAVVTGSNKGIGFGIVKGLCEKFKGKVYLTARDEKRGLDAVQKLKELGLNPVFHQLDINDQTSIETFRDHIVKTDGGIDVLVNNAAIAYKVLDTAPFSKQAEGTIAVNYFGTLRVCETLFSILRPNAQVINISSYCGHLSKISSPDLRKKLGDPKLIIKDLNDLMNQFVKDAKEGKHVECGWGSSAYNVSKVGVSALTLIQQRNFDNENEKRNISVNSVHPGYVVTDMTSHQGKMNIDQGAVATLYLALEPHTWKGQYIWEDATVVDWFASSHPVPY